MSGRVFRRDAVLIGCELCLLGGIGHRGGRRPATLDGNRDRVEPAGADLALMACRGVTVGFGGEFGVLQFAIGFHAAVTIAGGKLIHRVVQRMEAGQGDELVFVAHGADLALEACDVLGRQIGRPVEAWRAVVGKHLVRVSAVDGLGETFRLFEVGGRGFHPQQICIFGEGEAAHDAALEGLPGVEPEEAFLVRSPVRNGRSRSSTSDVMSFALSASVRATIMVGTPAVSAARRAAFRLAICC